MKNNLMGTASKHLMLCIAVLATVTACKQRSGGIRAATPTTTVSNTETISSPTASKIIYVAVDMERDTNKYSINLKLDTVMYFDGSLGKKGNIDSELKPGYLLCTFLDNAYKPIKIVVVPNPLYRYVEYEKENKELARKQQELKSGGFSIRTDFIKGMNYLQVESIATDLTLKLLGNVKIQ